MRRLRLLVVAFGAAGLVLAAGRSIAAQSATPQAGTGVELPAGITRQDFAMGSATPLLPTGATIELVRFTFAPGAVVVLPEASPSLALVYVEAGVLRVRIDAPVTLTRAAAGGSAGNLRRSRPGQRSRLARMTSLSVHPTSRSRRATTDRSHSSS
jgi:hypothetical protein